MPNHLISVEQFEREVVTLFAKNLITPKAFYLELFWELVKGVDGLQSLQAGDVRRRTGSLQMNAMADHPPSHPPKRRKKKKKPKRNPVAVTR